jgi:hypothetical protein
LTDNLAVVIEHGYHTIDAAAWVRQRTHGPLAELTTDLSRFLQHPAFASPDRPADLTLRMQLWCTARGWTINPDTTHYLHDTCLSEPVGVVLATDPGRADYALVQIGSDPPQVLRDLTTDADSWVQVTPVDIVCSAGHRWTWLDDTSLLDQHGNYIEFSALFGTAAGEPYSSCRDCTAYLEGDRDTPCLCDGRDVIYCPSCDRKCRLQLTPVPTIMFRDQL